MKKNIIFLGLMFCVITESSAQVAFGNYIITLSASGKALDADYPNINKNDCKVHLWDSNRGLTQIWNISQIDLEKDDRINSSYQIMLAASGKVLDANIPDIYKNDCRVRLMESCKGCFSQSWLITKVSNGKYAITLEEGGQSLDADGPHIRDNDCIIHLWNKRADDFKTQTWNLERYYPTIFDLNGAWSAGDNSKIVITNKDNNITINMAPYGRPNAKGTIIDDTTISAIFPDDATITGKLQKPNRIKWSNGSVWVKK